jgi:general secretion pathway protein G
MSGRTRPAGFTLIEVLIVVVVIAVMIATITPQVLTYTKDARESSLRFNLQSLRTQIELYKLQHAGGLPDGTFNLKQLTSVTDSTGAQSTTGAIDASHTFGPYIPGGLPVQPFSGLNTVKLDSDAAGTTPTGAADPGRGWIYRPSTGEIWIDHATYVAW